MKVSKVSNKNILVPCSLGNFNYQIDPYVGCEHNCYYCYALNQAQSDWSKEIYIYEDIIAQLDKELEKISPQKIYLGCYTDPYQPCESEYLQTRRVLELLLEKGFTVSILTKSDLVTRDKDILKKMDDANVSVSIAFVDNDMRKLFEESTIDTEQRVSALMQLKEAGVRVSSLICPVIPYINEIEPLIEMVKNEIQTLWVYGLSIDNKESKNWNNIERILNDNFFGKKSKIEKAIFNKDDLFWTQLRNNLLTIERKCKIELQLHF